MAQRMHPDEIDTDAELVRRLLSAQFPQWAALPIRRVASAGTDNALYRLSEDLVARLPRIHWAVANVDREHRWLPWLAPQLPVAVPTPLAKGAPGAGYPYPWSVYRWLTGANPVVGQLDDPHRLALELADVVAALQRIAPADGPPSGQALMEMDAGVRGWIDAARGLVDTVAVAAAWETALRTPTWVGSGITTNNPLIETIR